MSSPRKKTRTENTLHANKQALTNLRQQQLTIQRDIDEQGGRRLQTIQAEIKRLETQQQTQKTNFQDYQQLLSSLNIKTPKKIGEFELTKTTIAECYQQTESAIEEAQTKQVDYRIELKRLQDEQKKLQLEVQSLKSRNSNIPDRVLMLRNEIANTLQITPETIPFVGELLQVDSTQSKWKGAIERVLHHFGLSLLVPEHLYTQVSRYVEKTNLKGKLVYYRTAVKHTTSSKQLSPHSLVEKLQIKPNQPFYDWLEGELIQRFDYTCCESLDDFARYPKALSINGQIKASRQRHEKDDRHRLHDRSRYVLGWSNREKIKAFEQQIKQIEAEGKQLAERFEKVVKELSRLTRLRDSCRDAQRFQHFDEIDWKQTSLLIQNLFEEKRQIESSSNVLKTLQEKLEKTIKDISQLEESLAENQKNLGALEIKITEREQRQGYILSLVEGLTQDEGVLATLADWKEKILADKKIHLANIEKSQSIVREKLQNQIDNKIRASKNLQDKITSSMQSYANQYPEDTQEVDAAVESIADYERMLIRLSEEDLPRHEVHFKRLLTEGTINSVALFYNQLQKEQQDIKQKIEKINQSLKDIEYNTGTYISLLTDQTQDYDIKEFQQALKQCLSETLNDDTLYGEQKFLQVKTLIDRFNGREGLVDLDMRWTKKVTDVRNWFSFSVSERLIETDEQVDFHSDSSGKSGGQKEKLAYTILASALVYQFGLEYGETKTRSFRFVAIDEAFGKGSDDSTRYGLELFKKLNLQLLIVTPLQKIHIIENYIRSIHFVHNEEGCHSSVKNISIEKYRKEKDNYVKSAALEEV